MEAEKKNFAKKIAGHKKEEERKQAGRLKYN